MKTMFTLLGWVVVGAVLAFGGQQIWKAYKANNPERAEAVAEKVTDAVDTGADALRETADAVRDELKASTGSDDAGAAPAETAKNDTVTDAAKTSEPSAATAADTTDTAAPKAEAKPVSRDKAVEERFYAIASGNLTEPAVTAEESVAKPETAADYEKRQEGNRRKEEVLIQRQMRIVDELTVD